MQSKSEAGTSYISRDSFSQPPALVFPPSIHEQRPQLSFSRRHHHAPHKYVWNSHTKSDAYYDKRSAYAIMHGHSDLPHHTVHVDDGKERAIH